MSSVGNLHFVGLTHVATGSGCGHSEGSELSSRVSSYSTDDTSPSSETGRCIAHRVSGGDLLWTVQGTTWRARSASLYRGLEAEHPAGSRG